LAIGFKRWQYFESQKEYWDNYSIMTTALNKGLAQGRAEGRAEGFAEGEAKANRENARRMKTRAIFFIGSFQGE
jgi:flagellar biosynthesis/type III secretory pathway protein FliH